MRWSGSYRLFVSYVGHGPIMDREKCGIRALGFVSVGSVWSLGIFESSQFDLPLYALMNMSRTLELFQCLEFFSALDLCLGTVAIVCILACI